MLDAKLRELELAAWGGDWLQRPVNARVVAERLVRVWPELLKALPAGALEDLAGSAALAVARSVPAAPTASALLAAVWNGGRAQPLVERGAELLGAYLEEHQEVILEKVQQQSWRWLPSFVDKAIARKITGGLLQLLADVRQPDHPWRARLGDAVERLIVRLAEDADLRRPGRGPEAAVARRSVDGRARAPALGRDATTPGRHRPGRRHRAEDAGGNPGDQPGRLAEPRHRRAKHL